MTTQPKIDGVFRAKLQWLQGDQSELTNEIMLCLLIQPNCPGCLHHAIPTANLLASSTDFDMYCVSTAFEDFEYNTVDSARDLLEGRLVGASEERLGSTSTFAIPSMPFAHDIVVDRDDASLDVKSMALTALIKNAREQLRLMKVREDAIDEALEHVDYHALPERLAELFWMVRAQGTPTWIAHRSNGEILGVDFGHRNEKELRHWIKRLLKVKPTEV